MPFDLGTIFVPVNPNYYRPTKVELLIGDASNAKNKLGWVPNTSLEELVEIMVKNDMNEIVKKVEKVEVGI